MALSMHANPLNLTRRTTVAALSAALLAPGAGRAQALRARSGITCTFGSPASGALRCCQSLVWHSHTARFAPSIASRIRRPNAQLISERALSASRLQSWPLRTPRSTGIHDVAPAPDGGVWFSAQRSGHLGWFDPRSGNTELIALRSESSGSSPHGVIAGPDGAAWLTDGGQNAIARVSWPARAVTLFALPPGTPYANLNTCAFDGNGDLWFTGQGGYIGKVAVRSGVVSVKESPRGRGPYGMCATPGGDVWWCSLAGSFIAQIDRQTGASRLVEPPTPRQGARRVWPDSRGRIWVAEWNSGNLSVHDPALGTGAGSWRSWKAPGADPRVYAVYVDDKDMVWATEWSNNTVLRFDPGREKFDALAMPRPAANIRQILGRPGEVWLPESGTEFISVIKTA